MVSATGPARAARADAAGPVEEEDEGYAATLAKERSAVPGSHAYQEQLQPGRDGEDPEDLDTDAVAESDQGQVRDPRREKNAPETQVEDRENAHPFIASTRGAAYCTRGWRYDRWARHSAMEPAELEEVPLTDQDKREVVDAWLSYVHGLPADSEPDMTTLKQTPIFKATLNRVLAAHDFEPFTATIRWGADNQVILLARRLPVARPIE